MSVAGGRSQQEVEADIAVVCGQLNALHGRLVELLAEADAVGASAGLASPAAYATWQTGSTPAQGRALATVAARRDELPETTKALDAGEISLHQAAAIARHTPSWADGEARAFAESMTPSQLSRVCSRYERPDDESADDEARLAEQRRRASAGHRDGSTWGLEALLPTDEGEAVHAALRSHHDALFAERADGEPMPDLADALVRMAERSLGGPSDARRPRHRVLVHVELDGDDGPRGRFHLGPALPRSLRRHLGCDASYQAIYERDGRPIGVGRTRTIPEALRIAVEDRDGGCRVPGCQRRHVQLHHVIHWEDGGLTEADNLIALCPRHHRAHHLGELGIRGDDADTNTGIEFTRYGQVLRRRPPPTPPDAATPPPAADAYRHPVGERLQGWAVQLSPPPENPAQSPDPSGLTPEP